MLGITRRAKRRTRYENKEVIFCRYEVKLFFPHSPKFIIENLFPCAKIGYTYIQEFAYLEGFYFQLIQLNN